MKGFHFATWLLAGALACVAAQAADPAPQKLLLWPDGAPGAMPQGGDETVRVTEQGEHVVSNVHKPSLTVYLPKQNAAGAGVVILPGGGHRELWTDHEGHSLARFLNERGVAAFVVYYRLERAPGSTYKIEEHALNDVQQAIRLVRSRSQEWHVNPGKVGVMGFSAGGQLALLSAMRYQLAEISTRPDFVALIYPGTWPDVKFDANTPPMFLLAGSDDRPQVLAGLTQIYTQLREVKVPAELHLFDGVPHGFGVRATNTGPVTQWPQQFVEWLKVRKIL
jgi:endo-1,4-beta-xylanase